VVVHTASADNAAHAFALSRLAAPDLRHTPIGVFRMVRRPTYDDLLRSQIRPAEADRSGHLQRLLLGDDTWTIP